MDALLDRSDPSHPKEAEWPVFRQEREVVVVGNPPFLGSKMLRRELGDEYVDHLLAGFKGRVPAEADLCCYWFEKARAYIEQGKLDRAGLLSTQAIRGGANREVLRRIKESGDIFFAVSDRDWILDGANVHISMVGFTDKKVGPLGEASLPILDGKPVSCINANLTSDADTTGAARQAANLGISFMGVTSRRPF